MKRALLFAAFAAFSAAKADTVVWYDFDGLGEAGTTIADGATVVNKANPGTHDATVYGMNGANKYAGSIHVPYVTNGVPETFRIIDPVGDGCATFVDSALRFPCIQPTQQGAMLEIPNAAALRPTAFTVETFVRFLPGNLGRTGGTHQNFVVLAMQKSQSVAFAWKMCFNWYNQFMVSMISSGGSAIEMKVNPSSMDFEDGEWHHVAFSIEQGESTSILKLYVDYALKTTKTLDFLVQFSDSADCPVTVGGTTQAQQNFTGEIGEFRFSNVALTPSQFLTRAKVPSSPTIAHLKFENGSVNSGGAILTNGTISASQIAFSDDVPGWKIVDGEGGAALVKPDLASLSCQGTSGHVDWTDWDDLYYLRKDTNGNERTSGTVELWVKGSVKKTFAAILDAKMTANGLYDDNLHAWKLGYDASDGGKPSVLFRYLMADGTRDNQRLTFNVVATDGKWHHWAFTFQPNASDSTKSDVAFYFEHEKVGETQTLNGRMAYDDTLRFAIGEGGSSFTGQIDELRISDRVLTPAQFLCAENQSGLTIFIR